MKRLFVFSLISALIMHAHAQIKSGNPGNYSPNWSEGIIIFVSGDTLPCNLRYNQEVAHGLLQVLDGDNAVTLSVQDVKAFSFHDTEKNIIRHFFTLPVLPNQSRPECFVESLYTDNMFSIVNHKTIGMPYDYMNYSRFISKPSRISKKYIVNIATGEILPLSKEHALQIMGKRKSEVSSFIDRYNIKFRKVADYIFVFQYHASL
jgi:hypothetical protein